MAAWFLDGDYDGRCFCITQAFFPDKSAWEKLSEALTGVVDSERFAALSGTRSLPFPAGKHKCVAVKVIDLPLINALRKDVDRWREAGYRGASNVTRELLKHWSREDRGRRLFFCRLEAVETIIYLSELRIPGRSTRTGFKNFEVTDEDLALMLRGDRPRFYTAEGDYFPRLVDPSPDATQIALRRLGAKMATGSGKTVVMSMLIAWGLCNRGVNPESTEFPNGVLVVCPNLTVKERL